MTPLSEQLDTLDTKCFNFHTLDTDDDDTDEDYDDADEKWSLVIRGDRFFAILKSICHNIWQIIFFKLFVGCLYIISQSLINFRLKLVEK